jgi:hypothetical protein
MKPPASPAPKAGFAVRAQDSGDTDGLDPMRNVPASSFAISNRDVLNDNALGLGSINARIDDDGLSVAPRCFFAPVSIFTQVWRWRVCGWRKGPGRLSCAPLMCAAKAAIAQALACRG